MKATKNYSAESIRTILDTYMRQNKRALFQQMNKENTLLKFQIEKSDLAMATLLDLMDQGFREWEAWEIVSKEIVYF